MKRISVDIGGTFTDCFVAWDGRYIQAKALTTHHNLSQGFNEALDHACTILDLARDDVLRGVDSVRYATTLGTNALIERRGPQVGVIVTAGFEATIPLSRGRGYGEGLDELARNDMSSGTRPDPLVPQTLIRSVAERVDYRGTVLMELGREDVRQALRELIDAGAAALVVCLTNAIENPAHELRVQEVFLSEYPAHQLGAIPMLLSHQLSGRKGEYVRATSAIVDGFLHATMYHALSDLEQNLREHGYPRPMLIIHNSGGMAQLNSTDALQTIHSGPVAGFRRHGPAELDRRAADHPLRAGGRHLGERAPRRPGGPGERSGHRHGRHQLRHRPGPGRRGEALRLHAGHRQVAG